MNSSRSSDEKEKKSSLDLEIEIKKPPTIELIPSFPEVNHSARVIEKYTTDEPEKKANPSNSIFDKKPDSMSEKNMKIKGYFGGLKLITLMVEEGVPFNSKILIFGATITIITSFILYVFEIDTFSNSTCSEKHYVPAFIYINLIILISIMASVLNLFNLELINRTPYQFKATFLRPWLLWGICPIFEMPLMIYDHNNCQMQNPLYHYKDSYDIINAVGIMYLAILGIFVIFLTCMMSGIDCAGLMACFKKIFINILLPMIVISLNVMSFLMTFTQVKFFLPVLYFHNYVYYLMAILMFVFYVLLRACKMQDKFYINEKITEFSKIT